jgi:membrane protease YdiL (CAAX protease family)
MQHVEGQAQQPGLLAAYRETLSPWLHSPAIWLFSALFLLANLYLVLSGHTALLFYSGVALTLLVFAILVLTPLTAGRPTPAWQEPARQSRRRLWWQVGLVVLLMLALPISRYLLSGALASTPGLGTIYTLVVFVVEPGIPVVLMLLMGARWRELGFGRGYHTWRSFFALMTPLLIILAVVLLLRHLTLLIIPLGIVSNLIADGVPEEFAFRGVLMTRMVSLLGAQWGIVLCSLFFGIVHISNYMDQLHVDPLTALAVCVTLPALSGIFFCFILQRTRNLLSGVFVHANIDAIFNTINPLLPWLH